MEQHTRFTLDSGIFYNGVWNAIKWQMNGTGTVQGGVLDKNMAPPEGFVYCSMGYAWDGKGNLEGISNEIWNRRKDHSSMMLIRSQFLS